MKSFTIIKSEIDNFETVYRLIFIDDKGIQQDHGEVKEVDIVKGIEFLVSWINSLKTEEEQKIDELKERMNKAVKVIQETMTDEEKINFVSLYPLFEIEKEYNIGDEFQYQGKIYRVLQQHISQEHWKPTEAVSLYVDIENKLNIQEFKQPTGSHDAYMINDEVLFSGIEYLSIIDNNVWSPTDYPQGWQKIREE